MAHATAGMVRGIKSPLRLSGTPLETYVAPPALGQHTAEVLKSLLGLSAEEIESLRAEAVI